jgi:molybdopterin-guanine dinucleotide biosynthesis protein A
VYARSALVVAEIALSGRDRSLRGLIDGLRTIRVTQAEWRAAGISERFSRNVNTPADIARLSLELDRPAR